MFDEAKLGDLLLEWDERRMSGDELSVEQLCGGCEELIPVLNDRINCLRATDWLFDEDEDDEDLVNLSTRVTELPVSSLTVDEFTKSVVDSGLLSSAEIQQLKRQLPDDDEEEEAQQLAQKLVADGKLTKYQASVLLQNKSDPLLIDKYLILDVLGSGGMGVVFKALHKAMDRVVALKILPRSAIDSPDKVARFQREVKAAAKLSHPNIVTAHDADESKGIHFLVMEYVRGHNLNDWVNEHGPATVSEAIDFTLQVARGLAHAHEHGIVHRDVKPANLILDTGGRVKIVDMGLAVIERTNDAASTQFSTLAGSVMGTAMFMSPEQALDTTEADERSDIYSLGGTLYFLLTGRPPYEERTLMKTILAHRESAIPSLRAFNEEIPERLDELLCRMMAKRPERRYQSMNDLICDLEACARECSVAADCQSMPTAFSSQGKITANTGVLSTAKPSHVPEKPAIGEEDHGRPIVLLGCLFAAVLVIALPVVAGVIIFLKMNGKVTKVEVPDGASVEIQQDGSVLVDVTQSPPTDSKFRERTESIQFALSKGKRLEGQTSPVASITFCPDSRFALSGGFDRIIYLWNIETGERVRAFQGHENIVCSLSVSPDGKFFASGSPDGTVRIWQLDSGDEIQQLPGHEGYVNVSYLPNGRLLSGSNDGIIHVWDVESGDELDRFDFGKAVNSIDTASDGMSALIGVGGTVVLWDLEDKNIRHQSDRHGAVIDVAYSPDEKRAVSSHHLHAPILWDLATGEIIREFDGHDGRVNSVNFSPNGKLLFSSCGNDRTIRIWDVATGKEIGRVVAESHCTRLSALSPDGRTVVSGGGYYFDADANEYKREGDYALRVWRVTNETNSEKHGPPEAARK